MTDERLRALHRQATTPVEQAAYEVELVRAGHPSRAILQRRLVDALRVHVAVRVCEHVRAAEGLRQWMHLVYDEVTVDVLGEDALLAIQQGVSPILIDPPWPSASFPTGDYVPPSGWSGDAPPE